jgi:hypothetical protein
MIETARLGHRPKGLARTARDSVPELRNELRPRTLERSGDVAVFISQRRPAADGQPPHLLTVERAKLRGLERGVMPPEPAGKTLKRVGLSGRSRAPVTPPPPRGDRITIVERRLWQARPPSTVMICRRMSPAPTCRSSGALAALEPNRRIDIAHIGAGAERAPAADRLKHEQTLARSGDTRNGSSSASRSAPTARVDSADGNVSPGGAVRGRPYELMALPRSHSRPPHVGGGPWPTPRDSAAPALRLFSLAPHSDARRDHSLASPFSTSVVPLTGGTRLALMRSCSSIGSIVAI